MSDVETVPAASPPAGTTPSAAPPAPASPPARRVHRMGVMRRLIHWTNALSIVAATITGLYIANPYYSSDSGFVMAWNRTIHLTGAIVLDVSVIVIAYLYFFSWTDPSARRELRPNKSNLVRWQEAFLNVVMLNRRKRFDSRFPDPFNTTLFVLLHLMVVFQLFTGLQLYVQGLSGGTSAIGDWWPWVIHVTTDWTRPAFGGLSGVRQIHHFMTYPIVAWAMLHIYYEIWRTVMWKEGDIAISFGGYKFGRDESPR